MSKEKYIHRSLRPEKIRKVGKGTPIYVWSRASRISPALVGKEVYIHNGQSFIRKKIGEENLGYRFGEFARTRRRGVEARPKVSSRKGGTAKRKKSPALNPRPPKKKLTLTP